MIIYTEKINDTKAKITSISYGESTTEDVELGVGQYQVTEIPEAENIAKKSSMMYFNPQTEEITFEYVDRPATTEEKLSDMEEKINQILALLSGLV